MTATTVATSILKMRQRVWPRSAAYLLAQTGASTPATRTPVPLMPAATLCSCVTSSCAHTVYGDPVGDHLAWRRRTSHLLMGLSHVRTGGPILAPTFTG